METITPTLWIDTAPVNILGMKLTSTMTILKLRDEALLLHSPLPLTHERRDWICSLGRVAHLYVPNTFHHLWVGDWAKAFPEARLHAPSGLSRKRSDLRIDRLHDQEREPSFEGVLDEVPIHGFRMMETVLVFHPSSAAIVTDLAHNVGRPTQAWAKLYTKAMGFYDQVALSSAIRWGGFDDKNAARQSVDALLAHSFERLLVGHGAPLLSGGHAALTNATQWLPTANALQRRPGRRFEFSAKPCG
jgi:hypothetical protein